MRLALGRVSGPLLPALLLPALLLPIVAHADCGARPPRHGAIEVCVREPLRFGSMTAPSTAPGTVTITPDGERVNSFGLDEDRHRRDDYRPAELLIRGAPHHRFALRFRGDPALSDFTTDVGDEAELDGNGERLVRVGATLAVAPRGGGPIASHFTVTARPLN